MNFNLDYERLLKLIQGLSFTTFLILLVVAMSYAVTHLYTDSRSDWNQVQANTQNINQMSDKVDELIGRIDKLVDGLNTCLRKTSLVPAISEGVLGVKLLPAPVYQAIFPGQVNPIQKEQGK